MSYEILCHKRGNGNGAMLCMEEIVFTVPTKRPVTEGQPGRH